MATYPLRVAITGDMKGLASSFSAISKKSALPVAALAGVTAGAVAATKALYGVGEEFKEAGNTIRVGTGATGKALKGLEKDFKNVFASVPASAADASTAIADLNTRLGLSGKPLRKLSKQFLELSRMTGDDLKGTIENVSKAFEDAEVPIKKHGKALDYLFRASQASGTPIADLTKLMKEFGSPLRQLGIDFQESTAMFALFEKAGVNVQTMVPGLKFALKTFLSEGRDPAKALQKSFEGISDGTISAEKALKLFGQRAGPDMVEAINQGRFEFGAFQKQLEGGTDSIMKAGKETRTASDNFQILGNKLKVLVAPAAEWLYDAVGKLSLAFATMNFKPLLRDLGLSEQSMKDVQAVARAMGKVFQEVVLPLVKGALGAIKNQLKAFAGVVKGAVRVVAAILRGDFGEAWEGVKDIFKTGVDAAKGLIKGATLPMRLAAKGIDSALTSVFGGTWETIKGVFKDGANAAVDVLNAMIDVINKVPFVDIGDVGNVQTGNSGGGSTTAGSRGGRPAGATNPKRRRRGGTLPGTGTGDSIPAMLEPGEYVLNRNAVRAIGTSTLDSINFGMAPRFQEGGPVYLSIGGDILKAAKGIGSKAFGALKSAVPDLSGFTGKFPDWMDGGWFVDSALNWLLGKTKDQPKKFGKFSGLGTKGGNLAKAMGLALSMGLTITSTTGGKHAPNSYHYQGRAFDASNSTGPTPEMHAFALAVANRWGANTLEMFYDPLGWYIKHGARVPGSIGGHSNHVHVAMQSGGVVKTIGRKLLANGLDYKAAAGIIGNAWQESSWNPAAIEPGTHNGGLWGFTASPVSLAELKSYASSKGRPWTDVGIQTQFMLNHLPGSLRSKLNAADSVADTASIFMTDWERPGIPNLPRRVEGARKALDILLGMNGTSSAAKKKAAPVKTGLGKRGDSRFPGVKSGAGGITAPKGTAKGKGGGKTSGKVVDVGTPYLPGMSREEAVGLGHGLAWANEQLANEPIEIEVDPDLLAKALGQPTQAEKDVIAEHTAAVEANTAVIDKQTALAESAMATNSASAWRALADILSGNLGARGQLQAALPGNGTIGSLGNI